MVRLRDTEFRILDLLRASERLGHLSRSEYVRWLILREHHRRSNLPPPRPVEYQSELRCGRPKKGQI
jgi:hypothetical protein